MPNEELQRQVLSLLTTITERIRLWIPIRKESIRLLREIADRLDDTKNQVNIAKITGSATGIAGGILLGVGAVASIFTMGAAAAPFLIGGGITAAAGGGLVSGGAEVAMLVNDKRHLLNIKEILKKDKSKQEEVLREARKLQDLITQVSQEENISEEEALSILLEMFVNRGRARRGLNSPPHQRRKMGDLLRNGLESLLQSPLTTVAVTVPGLVRILGAATEWSMLAARNAARVTTAVLTPILVAIDTYQLVTTAKDVDQGSKSELGGRLREIANGLKAELKAYEKVQQDLESVRKDLAPE